MLMPSRSLGKELCCLLEHGMLEDNPTGPRGGHIESSRYSRAGDDHRNTQSALPHFSLSSLKRIIADPPPLPEEKKT